jgi:hypothetical protein
MKGWFFEKYRHSLAAKGIRTNRYSFEVFKKDHSRGILDAFKSPEEKSDIGKERKNSVVMNSRMVLEAKAAALQNKREISFEDTQRFFDHEFNPIADRFRNGRMTEEEFQREVGTAWDYFTKKNMKVLRPFAWGDEKKGPGLFDFEGKMRQA